MAEQNSIPVRPGTQRRLVVEPVTLSAADRAAHEAASYVRRSAKAA